MKPPGVDGAPYRILGWVALLIVALALTAHGELIAQYNVIMSPGCTYGYFIINVYRSGDVYYVYLEGYGNNPYSPFNCYVGCTRGWAVNGTCGYHYVNATELILVNYGFGLYYHPPRYFKLVMSDSGGSYSIIMYNETNDQVPVPSWTIDEKLDSYGCNASIVNGVIVVECPGLKTPSQTTTTSTGTSVNIVVNFNFTLNTSITPMINVSFNVVSVGSIEGCQCSNWTFVPVSWDAIVDVTGYIGAGLVNPLYYFMVGGAGEWCEAHLVLANTPPSVDEGELPSGVLDVVVRPRPYPDAIYGNVSVYKATIYQNVAPGDYYEYIVLYLPGCKALVWVNNGTVHIPDPLEQVPPLARPIVKGLLWIVDAIKGAVYAALPPAARQFLDNAARLIGTLGTVVYTVLVNIGAYIPLLVVGLVLASIENPYALIELTLKLFDYLRRLITAIINALKP